MGRFAHPIRLSIDSADLRRTSRRRWSDFNRTRVATIATRCVTPRGLTSRGWIHGPGNDGLIKVVEDADRRVLVGATTMGPRGGDLLGIFELAIKLQIPSDELRHLIYAYPTFYRGTGEAVRKLGSDQHVPMR